jgi:hypothetical protein
MLSLRVSQLGSRVAPYQTPVFAEKNPTNGLLLAKSNTGGIFAKQRTNQFCPIYQTLFEQN